jgi:hypothetical protein
MQETLEGEGTLESIPPQVTYAVGYRFVITSGLVKKAGGVASWIDSIGKVWALDGTVVPDGAYHLTTSDGEILKVDNAGMGDWVIVVDIP